MSPVVNLADLKSDTPVRTGWGTVKRGNTDAQRACPAAGAPLLDEGGGGAMFIRMIPTQRGWWLVSAETILYYTVAAWSSYVWSVRLDPADLNGWSTPDYAYVSQHSALGWQSSVIDTAFLLEANTTYTAYLYSETTNASWAYWTGKDYFNISGEFIAEGLVA